MPVQYCLHFSYGEAFSKKKPQYHLGIIRLSLWNRRVLGGSCCLSHSLPSADNGMSARGELLPLSSWCPTLRMEGPVLSSCMGKGASSTAAQLFPSLSPLCPPLSAPRPCPEALWGRRSDVAPRAGKEGSHSWKSPVSWFGIALPAGSNVSSLPAFPNVGVACVPMSPFSLLPHVAIANFCACAWRAVV